MENRVNAVILNYRQQEGARRAAELLKRSRGIAVDVLVVDAPSDETDRDVLRRHISPDRLLLLPENLGYAGGMNAGIRFWQERMPNAPILLVTPDTHVNEDLAQELWRALNEDARIGAVGPVVVYREAPRRKIAAGGTINARGRMSPLRQVQAPTPYDTDWIEGCCMLLRPTAVAAVGGFDEAYFMYCEEVDLCYRLRERGWRVRVVPTASVLHPKDAGHLSSDSCYYLARNGYRFRARHFGTSVAVASFEMVRSSLWLTTIAMASTLLPTRWREARARWRDCRVQLQGAWAGTRDHLIGRYGRRVAARPHPD